MKRKLTAILCLILSLIMSVATLGGCNLVTTDPDKDMEQVVATVSIESGIKDNIYKQDLIIDYLNYGYYYVQYNGYTQKQVFNLIIDSQINNRILIQNAMKQLEEDADFAKNTNYAKWDVMRYIDEHDDLEATYHVYKSFADMLDSFATTEDDVKASDTNPAEVRTAPTDAGVEHDHAHDEKEMEEFVAEGLDTSSTPKRRTAFNQFVSFLKVNNLLGSKFDGKDLTTTDYYDQNVKAERESLLLTKYRNMFKDEMRAEYTFDKIEQAYLNELEEQKDWNNADFVTALENASASEPVLYGANGTYGYVYNLLLGIDEIQTERISAIDSAISNAEKEAQRNEILKTTRIKDLRSSWIEAGYDFDATKNVFTEGYTLVKDANNSLAFQGAVTEINPDREEDEDAKYKASARIYGLDEFIAGMNSYMATGTFDTSSKTVYVNENKNSYEGNSIYGAGTYKEDVEEYSGKINEMLFAFSTDAGSLNKYKGYLIKPEVDAANSEEYVTTFANAGRKLIEIGGQSYVIVASDYGYHVMFFSEVFNAKTTVASSLVEFLNKEYGEKNWQEYYAEMMADYNEWEDTDNYMYVLLESISSAKITNALNREERNVVNKYLYEKEGCVEKFEKAYSNLLN